MKRRFLGSALLLCTMVLSLRVGIADETPPTSIRPDCNVMLRANCSASQKTMLRQLTKALDIFATEDKMKEQNDVMPAFEVLPKDHFGLVNWTKAVADGLIAPKGSLTEKEKHYEGFLDNIVFMPANVHIMADVAFPHGMHTYWLSCGSCHPKPFSKVPGANKIVMKEIFAGQWCGKCHGKVAFSPWEYENCRRCHVLSKTNIGR